MRARKKPKLFSGVSQPRERLLRRIRGVIDEALAKETPFNSFAAPDPAPPQSYTPMPQPPMEFQTPPEPHPLPTGLGAGNVLRERIEGDYGHAYSFMIGQGVLTGLAYTDQRLPTGIAAPPPPPPPAGRGLSPEDKAQLDAISIRERKESAIYQLETQLEKTKNDGQGNGTGLPRTKQQVEAVNAAAKTLTFVASVFPGISDVSDLAAVVTGTDYLEFDPEKAKLSAGQRVFRAALLLIPNFLEVAGKGLLKGAAKVLDSAAGEAATRALAKNGDEVADAAGKLGKRFVDDDVTGAARKQLDDLIESQRRQKELLPILQDSCFAAGTPILTPYGSQPIETIGIGDLVLSRPDDDPNGPVRTRHVEALFELQAVIVDLHIGGQIIHTTAEHPFFVDGHGWKKAQLLEPGDRVLGHDGRATPVTCVSATSRTATVYNMRVAEDHTYFVGSRGWGFALWAHNSYYSSKSIRDDAIARAWREEAELVRRTGMGTRPWTDKQKLQLLENGRVRGYVGHHIFSVARHPLLAGLSENIEFVTWFQHLLRHGGNWRNPTRGSLLDRGV